MQSNDANAITVAIKDEFVNLVDVSKEYTLKELKDLITEVYKTKTAKKSKSKKTTKNTDTESSDDEKSKKPKKKATPYNVYVGERIKALKTEEPNATAIERMKMAAMGWKNLTDEEKKAYIRTDDNVVAVATESVSESEE